DALIKQGNFGGGNVQSNYAEGSIEQTGNDNQAEVNQRQGFSGGTAVSIHSVEQVGNSNKGFLTTFNGGNFGTVEQQGDDNYAKGRQAAGPNNELTIYQQGNDNQADIGQSSGSNNTAVIRQGGDIGGDINNNNGIAAIDQKGSDNMATIQQRQGWNGGTMVSDHSIDQLGDNNWATFTTFNGGNTGTIDQVGDGNWAQGRQSVGSGNNIEIAQDGMDNYAKAEQINSATSTALITQIGSDNSADVDQVGASNSVLIQQGVYGGAERSVAEFTQNGEDNYLEAKMVKSYDNTVTGSQEGDNNFYRAGVRGSDNTVSMDMVGDANKGSWTVGSLGGWPHQPEGNEVSIDVEGDGNITSGTVLGDFNEVTLIQEGNDNKIGTLWYSQDGVHISGEMNTVSVGQFSDGNSSMNTVVGNGNTINVVQQ
ncbi:MAG: hypothetical protein ACOCX0_03810, partial [Bacteroidota bacterium]